MNKPALLFLAALTASCVSVDVQKAVKTASGAGVQERREPRVLTVPIDAPEPVVIEKPVYVPQGTPPREPPRGRPAVEQAAKQGTAQPQDYSNAAMLYDYHRDFVYEVYCRPLRITDLRLKPGEKAAESPFISDSERWMLGAGISYESGAAVQHIYVKPTESSLEANLIINTNERVYHIILRSFPNIHMPMVRWRYPELALPQNYLGSAGQAAVLTAGDETDEPVSADPRFLSFNYRIVYGLFKKPRWLPALAYDDGKKTYLTFPDQVLQNELPTVFENRADIINYRVARNVMIIDKLIEQITVQIGTRTVTVHKKKGTK